MKNEKRLIDVNEAIEKINCLCVDGNENWIGTENQSFVDHGDVIDILSDMPTVDAVEVVHGRWIAVPSSDMMTGKAYKCSECNKMRYGSFMPNYCQNCGAKMDGGNEDVLL